MCGFDVRIVSEDEEQRTICAARGPDGHGRAVIDIADTGRRLVLDGWVLWLRGRSMVVQPYSGEDDEGRKRRAEPAEQLHLLWNGELFGCSDGRLVVGDDDSDTAVMFEALRAAVCQPPAKRQRHSGTDGQALLDERSEQADTIKQLLDTVEGPYSLALLHGRTLWFARDVLGRRSLLYRRRPSFAVASVLPVPAATPGHQLCSHCGQTNNPQCLFCRIDNHPTFPRPDHPPLSSFADWNEVPVDAIFAFDIVSQQLFSYPRHYPDNVHLFDSLSLSSDSSSSSSSLASSSSSSSLSSSSSSLSSSSSSLSSSDSSLSSSDSSSSSSDSSSSSTHQTAVESDDISLYWLQRRKPEFFPFGRRSRQSAVDYGRPFAEAVCGCHELLVDAVRRRVQQLRHVTVLFSGGLDSMVVAAIACDVLPAGSRLDLVNVSFAADGADAAAFEQVPDRATGRSGYAELVATRGGSGLAINFVAVDVRQSALQHAVQTFLPWLIYPHTTVMDATICAALWFAALHAHRDSKVVLLGHGADELFGGYSRHAQAYERRGGVDGLNLELELDLERMWQRNLGRDDRVIASLGKEARHPFLDERLVRFVYALPVDYVCDMRLPKGTGDKKLLRTVAADLLRLPTAAAMPKRAIQFGTRIAKFMPKSGRQQIPSD